MAKKERVEFNPSLHAEALQEMIKDASDLKIQMESMAEKIKEIKDRAKTECGVEGKQFNKWFRIFHKQERERFEDDADQTIAGYDQIFGRS